jgi:transcriptional regulator with AAA-type ATPase domain
VEARKGYFEVTNGGTIFLDEVGEMPLGTQARLLRVLENGEFIRVGSSKIQKTNVRVVAATNVNLLQAVEKGQFRETSTTASAPCPFTCRRCANGAPTCCCFSASLPPTSPRNTAPSR